MPNRSWVLRKRPTFQISGDHLELIDASIRPLRSGEVLVRNIYVSLSPTNRTWMSDREQYMPPVGTGEVMRGGTVGVIEASRSADRKVGELVAVGFGGWELYSLVPATEVRQVYRPDGIPLTAPLSVLGSTGLTAWFGVTDVARPAAGETLVVTAAAGALGSIAGQIGNQMGARVVGICGSDAEAGWITGDLGFDAAINYRTEDVAIALERHCPDGIDADFENVGGPMMDAILARMNKLGTYNHEGAVLGPTPFERVLMRQLSIRGFLVSEAFHQRSRRC